jgi:orotate phosphoribosyltransferase
MPAADTETLRYEFIDFAIGAGVLKFGEFKLKSGRLAPYFFNAGGFDNGARLLELARFYAQTIRASGVAFDMLFGPAYKGIVLAAATAMELARLGVSVPFSYNRKEAKDHGEGGTIVGAALAGRVLIIDDVISAGTSVRESVQLIQAAGATPAGVVIALDRMERGKGELSAVQEVNRDYGLPVLSVANLEDLLGRLGQRQGNTARPTAVCPTPPHRREFDMRNMEHTGLHALLAALALAVAPAAWADIYSCKDANGKQITSDSPATCHGKETRVIGPDGRTKQVIAAPMSMEQRKAKAEEDARKLEADKLAREQGRKDQALLDTYRSEADVEVKRQRALEQVQAEVKASEGRIVVLKKLNQELLDEAEFYKKKKMPADLRRKLDESEGAIAAENRTLQSKKDEVSLTNQKFDEDKKRFLELQKIHADASAGKATATNAGAAKSVPTTGTATSAKK